MKIIIITLFTLIISIYICITGFNNASKETQYCGTIVEIFNKPHHELQTNNYYVYYEQYFLVNFDSIGLKAIKVDMTTFMSNHIGDKVCFMLDKGQIGKSNTVDIIMFFMGITCIIINSVVLTNYLTIKYLL